MGWTDLSRREVLIGTGTGLGTLAGVPGTASAQETDRYNVGTASPEAERAARERAERVVRVLDWGNQEKTVTGNYNQEAADGLRNRRDVRYVEADGRWEALQTLPWGIDRVDADVAHSNGETGGDDGGGHVSIIDTGVDYTHRDLGGNYGYGYDFVNEDDDAMDDHGHGTHVAGTADAEDNDVDVIGTCTAASLYAAKVLDSGGSGYWSDIAAGIRWTADEGLDVGNLSLGGSSDSNAVRDAVQYAYNNGVLLVAAAGNDGPRPNSVLYPAKYDEVVAVSATNQTDDLAFFSSKGPEVELAAPGTDILSTTLGGGTGRKSGTSMASPHVAGAGGQLMDNGYTNTEARSRLQSTAEDLGLSSNEQGHGLVDVAAALGLDGSDDDDGGGDGGDNSPSASIDEGNISEVESPSPHAEFDVPWSASDQDGDLDTAELTLYDETDAGAVEDSESFDISGDSAGETTRLRALHDDGSGNDYTAELIVTDANGNSDTYTTEPFAENGS